MNVTYTVEINPDRYCYNSLTFNQRSSAHSYNLAVDNYDNTSAIEVCNTTHNVNLRTYEISESGLQL